MSSWMRRCSSSKQTQLSTSYSVQSTWKMQLVARTMDAWTQPRILLVLMVAVVGCGAPPAEFRGYETYAHKVAVSAGLEKGFSEQQRRDVDEALQALFGT